MHVYIYIYMRVQQYVNYILYLTSILYLYYIYIISILYYIYIILYYIILYYIILLFSQHFIQKVSNCAVVESGRHFRRQAASGSRELSHWMCPNRVCPMFVAVFIGLV